MKIHLIIDVGYALEFNNLADVSDKWNPVYSIVINVPCIASIFEKQEFM